MHDAACRGDGFVRSRRASPQAPEADRSAGAHERLHVAALRGVERLPCGTARDQLAGRAERSVEIALTTDADDLEYVARRRADFDEDSFEVDAQRIVRRFGRLFERTGDPEHPGA